MTFVDTTVFVYAVGAAHPLRDQARGFFGDAVRSGTVLVSSAEVMQELLHVYLPVGRLPSLDRALELFERTVADPWTVEPDDVRLARTLAERHPGLSARDLVHLASCVRRDVTRVKTFDRALAAAFDG